MSSDCMDGATKNLDALKAALIDIYETSSEKDKKILHEIDTRICPPLPR